MGEAKNKRRRMTDEEIIAQALTRELANQGKLVEAGWQALRAMWVPIDAPEQQVTDMRWAFMAGAQHLYASIMGTLDEGQEPSDADMRRMSLIAEELDRFADEVKLRTSKSEGSA